MDLRIYGYLLKSASVGEIAHAIRTVAAGASYLSAEAASRLPDGAMLGPRPAGLPTARLGRLTSREREVLRLVASDLSCKEIAVKLGLSARTVDRHKANIMEKLDIHSQVGLTRFAVAEGVCDPRARV
jgi:DNA-binding NarL/FixJ family response regulator